MSWIFVNKYYEKKDLIIGFNGLLDEMCFDIWVKSFIERNTEYVKRI